MDYLPVAVEFVTFLDLASSLIRSARELVTPARRVQQAQLRTQGTVVAKTVGHPQTVSPLKSMAHTDVKYDEELFLYTVRP